MADGTETIDQTAPETAGGTVETEPSQEPVNLDAPVEGAEGSDEADAPVVDDSEEIDFDGEKYRVPKKLKDGFLMQSDYTKKTQDIAEQRKALEAANVSAKQEAETFRAHIQDVGRVIALNDQLEQYEKVDWAGLEQSDPFKAQELFRQRFLLKEHRDSIAQQVMNKEQQRSLEAQQTFAKRYAETDAALAKDIKGWNKELGTKLRDFAMTNGTSDEDLRTLAVNVPLVKLLHKAWLGEQLVNAKQTQAKAADPKIEAKPLTKVNGAGARPSVNLADADMDAYVAQRKKQGFGKR